MVFGDPAQIPSIHGVQAEVIDLQPGQCGVRDMAIHRRIALYERDIPHPAQQAAGNAGGASGPARDLDGAFVGKGKTEQAGAPDDDLTEFLGGIEYQPQRNAEPVAQRCRQQTGTRGGPDQRKRRQVDPHASRRRPFADDQIELEVFHRGVQDFLDRWLQAMDFVDE